MDRTYTDAAFLDEKNAAVETAASMSGIVKETASARNKAELMRDDRTEATAFPEIAGCGALKCAGISNSRKPG